MEFLLEKGRKVIPFAPEVLPTYKRKNSLRKLRSATLEACEVVQEALQLHCIEADPIYFLLLFFKIFY